MPLLLTSPAIPPSGTIPQEYTCDGSDISPPLAWSGVPVGTASLVLVIEDPDAPRGTFRHWAAYDIAPTTRQLIAGHRRGQPAADFHEARNDFGAIGYGGPCPPAGSTHRYHFTLLALNRASLGLPPTADIAAVLTAAAPYVVERAELVASYHR